MRRDLTLLSTPQYDPRQTSLGRCDSGLPGFDTSIWFGLLAPVGVPDAIRDHLAEAIARALRSEAVINAFRAQEIEPLQGGPAALAKYIADETGKWADVAAKTGLVKP